MTVKELKELLNNFDEEDIVNIGITILTSSTETYILNQPTRIYEDGAYNLIIE